MATILLPKGVFKGPLEKGRQTYAFVGIDVKGEEYWMGYNCLPCYTDRMEKCFKILHPVEVKESDDKSGSNT